MALWFWDWTHLGTYDDVYGDEKAQSVRDKDGKIVWTFVPSDDPKKADICFVERFLNWKAPHYRIPYMPWLRYYIENGPYTSYLNISEILIFILFVQMGIYTYARMRTHVAFCRGEEDEEAPADGQEKSDMPVKYVRSWSKGLLARSA
ncbi:hypothetical protein K458DRAFT_396860 [Lentithecium fluviatile CBS 122367]|uniref:Uncharacterized protein n=1 Tax=Lentithecium fluviatile CBS 122367 TaxID=1168545 RepID=A0A6G1IEJ8_9PLEO|nr:hypothetical protein K458DRAFT_396860 [Lentithecium fluviatile CBS 122367]